MSRRHAPIGCAWLDDMQLQRLHPAARCAFYELGMGASRVDAGSFVSDVAANRTLSPANRKLLIASGLIREVEGGLELNTKHSLVYRSPKVAASAPVPSIGSPSVGQPLDNRSPSVDQPLDNGSQTDFTAPSKLPSESSALNKIRLDKIRLEESKYTSPQTDTFGHDQLGLGLVTKLPTHVGECIPTTDKSSSPSVAATQRQRETLSLFWLWAKLRGERFEGVRAVKPLRARLVKISFRLKNHTADDVAMAIIGAFERDWIAANINYAELESIIGNEEKFARNSSEAEAGGLEIGAGKFMAAWESCGPELFNGWFTADRQRALRALAGDEHGPTQESVKLLDVLQEESGEQSEPDEQPWSSFEFSGAIQNQPQEAV